MSYILILRHSGKIQHESFLNLNKINKLHNKKINLIAYLFHIFRIITYLKMIFATVTLLNYCMIHIYWKNQFITGSIIQIQQSDYTIQLTSEVFDDNPDYQLFHQLYL